MFLFVVVSDVQLRYVLTIFSIDACTCEKARDGGFNPALEIDFTTQK